MMIKTFEAYAKYKREKFKSEPLKVDDVFIFQYSNGKGKVKVKSINNGTVELYRSGGYGQQEWLSSDIITYPLSLAQKMKDDEHIEKHTKTQNFNEDVHNISKKLKLNKIVGGDLLQNKVIFELAEALDKLKFIGEEYNTQDSSVGAAGGWSGTMKASKSGTAISIVFNDIHRGGYYAGSTSFIVQIQVGGGLDYEKQKVLLEISKQLLSKYSYTTHLGTSRVADTGGTNWSSVMLVAPQNNNQYSPVTNLPIIYKNFQEKRKKIEDSAKKYNL